MKTNNSQKILSTIIKIYNNKLFITIVLICVFVFALYNIISPVYKCSLNIEGFDNSGSSNVDDNSVYTGNAISPSPFDKTYDSSKIKNFAKMFGNSDKCLAGCYSPTTSADPDIKNCKQNVSMTNSNKLYKECSWKCDKTFLDNSNLIGEKEIRKDYAEYIKKKYKPCETDDHCKGCTPKAYL
jgi:hypothetical protein